MKEICIILCSLFNASVCLGQLTEDFTDGNLTNNPEWTPDQATNWVVVANQLRSNAAAASSSFYITTPSNQATNAQWEFWVNLKFNTSGVNFVEVYLMADQADLHSATLNGYFVRIGGTPDEISLYKMEQGVATVMINGADGVTNTSNNVMRIKVVRDSANLWTLQRDATGGTTFLTEGTATDPTFSTSAFFGIRIKQSTASFFNKHFFDDLYAGEIITDTEPPVVAQIDVLNETQLDVVFDEPVHTASAQTVAHYSASHTLGNPTTATLQADQKTVSLTFGQPFQNGITHELTINGVTDLLDNTMSEVVVPFLFFQPAPVNFKDVILTEIFADPTPQVGLPDAEFVEVYNRSANPVDVGGWTLTDGSSTATLPTYILLPAHYLLLTASSSASHFDVPAEVIGVANFPTINNGGEALRLFASDQLLIDSVNFALSWYADEDKQAGGWSLELIDLENSCGEETNWIASEATRGGTPGVVNSVNANKPDLTGPRLLSVAIPTERELIFTFDEKLETEVNEESFAFDPALTVLAVEFASESLRQLRMLLRDPLQLKQRYTVTITGLRDCAANTIQDTHNRKDFALPEIAEVGDVLLNEILFNPRPGGVDFVEVVNTSDKFINLKNWSLANVTEAQISNAKIITEEDELLAQGSFAVITPDGAILKDHYPLAVETNFLMAATPSMPDDAGAIVLISETGLPVDQLLYDENFHTSLLKDTEGVSLERISTTEPTQEPSNWKSAASAAGLATPGYGNSNAKPGVTLGADHITVEPPIFSTDRPGQDFARIHYRFQQTGWVANVKIADQQGRVIKELANNETLGLSGFFRWDGDYDAGGRARFGYYFVWFEVFQLDGRVKTFRKRVVIAR